MGTSDRIGGTGNTRRKALLAALVVVVAVVLVILLQNSPGSDRAGAQPNPTAQTSPAATGGAPDESEINSPAAPLDTAPAVEPEISVAPGVTIAPDEQRSAAGSLQTFVREAAGALEAETLPSDEELEAVASGPAYGSLLADVQEFENNDWQQAGTPAVVSLEVVDHDPNSSPPQATVHACIDSSSVQVLNAEGENVRTAGTADRSLNIMTLHRSEDGQWLVNKVSFSDDPSC